MGKKRQTEHEHENEERWLLSYADMITLLMAFFVVLYAMSNVDSKKYEKLAASLSESLGPRQVTPVDLDLNPPLRREGERGRRVLQGDPPPPPAPAPPSPPAQDAKSQQELRREKAERLRDEVVSKLLGEDSKDEIMVSVSEDFREVSIRLAASLLFQPGSADMEPSAVPMLEEMAAILLPLKLPVKIEGHTDNVPINTPQFQSNWQLSAARAANVLLYMQNQFGLPPTLLSASGYGEFRPISDNETPDNRARNRRVEFVVAVPDEEESTGLESVQGAGELVLEQDREIRPEEAAGGINPPGAAAADN
ncbi:MAG: OmpA family protein [Candidatus Hydrogenedentes bacterium]|nr:OmpA family protein [Candidatus Hydrogenedentota bacterium]